jgi:hypothetical protein
MAGRNGCSDRAELGEGSIGGGGGGVGVVVVSTSILLAGVMYYLLLTWRKTKIQSQAQVGSRKGGREQSKQTALSSGIHQINPNPKSTPSHKLYTDIKLHNTFTAMLFFFPRVLPRPHPLPPLSSSSWSL